MLASSMLADPEARYELRFTGLHNRGRGYSFPCDAAGQVAMDELSTQARINYLQARALVGSELSTPVVGLVS